MGGWISVDQGYSFRKSGKQIACCRNLQYNLELMGYLGELAGLLTSVIWSGTSLLFTKASRDVGSIIVNRMRVVLSLLFLVLLNWLFSGYLLPLDAGLDRWMWFALSGAIGYALGDVFLFKSFVCIGPQRGTLMMSLAPLMSAGLAWIFFGEVLSGIQIAGIFLSLAGVYWVLLHKQIAVNFEGCDTAKGVLYGFAAALGQAVGFVLSKEGLADNFSPIAGNSIRMLAAVVILWVLAGLQGKAGETIQLMRRRPAVLGWLALASFTGPVLGATLSLYALQHTQVGIASTLIALPPVFLLPVNWLVYKEKFRWADLLGTLVTIGGVALLFLA